MTSNQPIETDPVSFRIRELVDLGYSIRKIAAEVNLSYTAVRYRLNKLQLHTRHGPEYVFQDGRQLACQICNRPLIGLQTKYCSTTCKGRAHGGNSYEAQKRRGITRKKQAAIKLGGSCQKCNYSTNLTALCFHHVDPTTTSFGLDSRAFSNRKWSVLLTELEKCALLCQNCHNEAHHPEFTGWSP